MDAPIDVSSDTWSNPAQELELIEGRVDVWHLCLDKPADRVARLRDLLSPDEVERADRFIRPEHTRRFVVVHGLLRLILSEYLGTAPRAIGFGKNEYGKPFLAEDSEVEFNLSDSGELALVALTHGHAIGVDVEHYHARLEAEKVAKRYFSPTEVARLFELPQERQLEAFYRCWTRKEGYIKARGEGLSLGLDRFDVSFSPGEPPALVRSEEGEDELARWSFRTLKVGPGYEAACVVEGAIDELRCWDAAHVDVDAGRA